MLDIFNNDAFSVTSLTDRINAMPFVPGQIGQLGLFNSRGISTTSLAIEEKAGVLNLIQSGKRGGPARQHSTGGRKLRSFVTAHLALEDTVLADEVQNVRLFGSQDALQPVQYVVDERLGEMVSAHDATVEYGRVGAIKGQLLDADGTVMYDLFNEFGVSQQTAAFALGTATTKVREKCMAAIRKIEGELGAISASGYVGVAGPNFFDKLTGHPTVEKAYEGWAAAETLGADLRGGFRFGGIEWVEYRGSVGGTDFIGADEAYIVPRGVPGLFITRFSPADFAETVNTVGLPRYARVAVDPEFGRYIKLHTQSNPISLCTRPRAVVKCTL